MRVVLFGASGNQGRRALGVLMRTPGIQTVVIVSRDPDRGAAIAASCLRSEAPVRPAVADIYDDLTLSAVLCEGDLVLNAAAPFFELGARLAKACVAAGAHYADICDDWEATVEILALDAEARARGVSLTTGFGSAPGVDSMLALAAGSALDRVDRLITAWSLGGGQAGPASLTPYKHLLQCCIGPIRLVRDGQLVDETPLQPLVLDYPEVGPIAAWTIGSPEAVTLHSAFPDVALCANVMRASADSVDGLRALAEMVRSGSLALDDAARVLRDAAAAPSPSAAEPDQAPRLFAWAEGMRGDRRVAVGAHLGDWPGGDYTLAGAALGAAAGLRRNGRLRHAGAVSIEAALSAPDYLNVLVTAGALPSSGSEIILCYETSGVAAT